MGRTKQLAAETQEQQDAKNKDTLASLEPSRKIKLKGIAIENFNALMAYLDSRPYKEVSLLVQVLKESPVVDATIINDTKG